MKYPTESTPNGSQQTGTIDFTAPPIDEGQPVPQKRRRIALVVLGIVLICGIVCVSLGAYFVSTKLNNKSSQILSLIAQSAGLRVTVEAKRASMQINGLTTAQVYLFPRMNANQSLEYDAYTAIPGSENLNQQFTLLNNKAYWANVDTNNTIVAAGCLAEIPPFRLSSLAHARVIDQVDSTHFDANESCPQNSLLELSFAGETFVLCNSPTNYLTKAVGQDVDLTIEYIGDATQLPDLSIPNLNGSPLSCPSIAEMVNNVAHGSTLSADISAVVSGAPRTASLISTPTCSGCQHGVKPCIFVHGVGGLGGETSESFESYWGNIGIQLPCCSSAHFVHIDLVHYRWDQLEIQQRFCEVALAATPSASRNSSTIGSVSLIAHSMGNLVIGAALANNVCKFSNDVSWFSLAAPMAGSKSANLLKNKCADGSWLQKPLDWIGMCPVEASFASLVHESTVNEAMQTKFNAAQEMRRRHVTRVLCGVSSTGLVSIYSPQTLLVGSLSHHDTPAHDGVVDMTSCTAGLGDEIEFGTTIDSPNYQGQLNHADCAFRYGDGWWGSDRKPIKWLQCTM